LPMVKERLDQEQMIELTFDATAIGVLPSVAARRESAQILSARKPTIFPCTFPRAKRRWLSVLSGERVTDGQGAARPGINDRTHIRCYGLLWLTVA
jgi:hypothetical protein